MSTRYRFHLHLHLPMKMEPIEGSETSAFKTQTPGKYPEENILHNVNSLFIQINHSKIEDRLRKQLCMDMTAITQLHYQLYITCQLHVSITTTTPLPPLPPSPLPPPVLPPLFLFLLLPSSFLFLPLLLPSSSSPSSAG